MVEHFFIGDTHFGHKGIIQFTETKVFRDFATIEEHDEELVRRWNSVVHPNDKVFHLGDFCFGRRNVDIAARLNGTKYLVMGNHDIYGSELYLRNFKEVMGVHSFDGHILSHIPLHHNQLYGEGRWCMNIHGHLHTRNVQVLKGVGGSFVQINDWRYYNVSAEQANLTPVPYDIILNRWAENH